MREQQITAGHYHHPGAGSVLLEGDAWVAYRHGSSGELDRIGSTGTMHAATALLLGLPWEREETVSQPCACPRPLFQAGPTHHSGSRTRCGCH